MPEGFYTGFEKMPLQEDWVWVAERDGAPQGVLMAAPCHGLIYMMRLCVKEGAPAITAFRLLRACMRDTKARGFKGFFMHIDPTSEKDIKVWPACKKSGALALPLPQQMIVGSIEKAARY